MFLSINARSFDRYVFMGLGHFAASALISAGLDVVTVSGALGHCNSGTTLNAYAHMFQTVQARVAQAMDGAFSFLPQDTTT